QLTGTGASWTEQREENGQWVATGDQGTAQLVGPDIEVHGVVPGGGLLPALRGFRAASAPNAQLLDAAPADTASGNRSFTAAQDVVRVRPLERPAREPDLQAGAGA